MKKLLVTSVVFGVLVGTIIWLLGIDVSAWRMMLMIFGILSAKDIATYAAEAFDR